MIEDNIYPRIIFFVVLVLFVIVSLGTVNREKHGIVVSRLFINPAFKGPFRPNSNTGFKLSRWISFFIDNIASIKREINIIINIELTLDMVSIPLLRVK